MCDIEWVLKSGSHPPVQPRARGQVELWVTGLQVFSACVMSFAHGSNDVANAMGPFSGVYYIWETREVPTKAPVRPLLC